MELIIKFPTRGRPKKFINVLEKYISYLDDKTTKIIITADNDDITMNNDFIIDVIDQYENATIKFGGNKTKVEAINNDLDDVTFDIILLASDDMIPMVKGYDTIIKNKFKQYYPDTDGVLWFNDGYQGKKLNTLCILGKKYYDRFGYIYNPNYKSVWCDNEFMDVANILGKQVYFDEIIIRHEHPDWGFGDRDIIHNLNIDNHHYDENIYTQRKKVNFYL